MSSTSRPLQFGNHHPPDEAWLALADVEEVIEPDLPIIDAHHHLWDIRGATNKSRGGQDVRYLLDEFAADTRTGHNVIASVFVECHMAWRADGPAELRPIGEIEFARGIAAMAASGHYGGTRVAAGIVGHVDLALGARVGPVLEQAIAAGGERLCAIRHSAHWDDDPAIRNGKEVTGPGLYRSTKFRAGLAQLIATGLAFDAWVFYPQLGDVIDLGRAFPDANIVLNHMGGPLGLGYYAARPHEAFQAWREAIRPLADCPNVSVKIGGATNRIYNFMTWDRPPTGAELADRWRRYVETTIEIFGPQRCMFESSFPVDKIGAGYRAHWNAFKLLTASASADEKSAMFSGTARRVYRLQV